MLPTLFIYFHIYVQAFFQSHSYYAMHSPSSFVSRSQSRGPLVQHFVYRGSFIGARALLGIYSNRYGLALPLACLIGEEGGILLVQMISTCLRGALRKEEGENQHPVVEVSLHGVPSRFNWTTLFLDGNKQAW
jgi:hypothetical protein